MFLFSEPIPKIGIRPVRNFTFNT